MNLFVVFRDQAEDSDATRYEIATAALDDGTSYLVLLVTRSFASASVQEGKRPD